MPNFSSLQQFFDTVTARLTKPKRGVGGSEGVVAADVLESLKDVARYADDARASINALNATVYVRGDVGDDARSGETNAATGYNGAVRSLARAAELHSGRRQNLVIDIQSGTVDVTSDIVIQVPEIMIFVRAGATLRFRKHPDLRDNNNIQVGEGTYGLRCFSNVLNIRNDGLIDVEAHNGILILGGNPTFYNLYQGAISIAGNSNMVPNQYQTVALMTFSNVTVGANATFVAAGSQGINSAQASKLAAYSRKSYSGSSVVLGANAVESTILGDRLRETLVFEGNGGSKTFNIRRTYAFSYALVYNDGCTVSVEPAANCAANANNTLTFTGAVGKTITVRLTSNQLFS